MPMMRGLDFRCKHNIHADDARSRLPGANITDMPFMSVCVCVMCIHIYVCMYIYIYIYIYIYMRSKLSDADKGILSVPTILIKAYCQFHYLHLKQYDSMTV